MFIWNQEFGCRSGADSRCATGLVRPDASSCIHTSASLSICSMSDSRYLIRRPLNRIAPSCLARSRRFIVSVQTPHRCASWRRLRNASGCGSELSRTFVDMARTWVTYEMLSGEETTRSSSPLRCAGEKPEGSGPILHSRPRRCAVDLRSNEDFPLVPLTQNLLQKSGIITVVGSS